MSLKDYEFQLEQVTTALAKDPSNASLAELEAELIDLIALTRQEEELERKEQEPARLKNEPSNFSNGDLVMARWVSGDNAYYPAKITSITGSSTVPIYAIKFLDYNSVESVPASAIKQMTENKRKSIQVELDQKQRQIDAKKQQALVAALPKGSVDMPVGPKKRRLKDKEEIDTSKAAWQSFKQKGVRKTGVVGTSVGRAQTIGEKSMFRTPDEFGGRVGVIGSGKGMQKEIGTRGKHIHQLD
jgi:survival-of-motor-neuron-related-splicing factor 30